MRRVVERPPEAEVLPEAGRRAPKPHRRLVLKIGVGAGALLAVLIAALVIYASTPYFANSVRARIVLALANATGGRVEIRGFHWSLFHLSAEVDGLTIHGLEAAGQAPYLEVARIHVHARILTLISPRIGLKSIEVDRPAFHLIVYPDGSTNQPRPRVRPKKKTDTLDTIFRLKVQRTEIRQGVALINQRSIPFDFSARDLSLSASYAPSTDHYLGHVEAADVVLQRGEHPAIHSELTLELELARNSAQIKALHFASGGSILQGSGSIVDFAHPRWSFSTTGDLDLREAAALAGIRELRGGIANLSLEARGTNADTYLISGWVKADQVGYRQADVKVEGARVETPVRVTPEEIALDGISVHLREGGEIHARLSLKDWRRHGPALILATLSGLRLPAVMRMVARPEFQKLGFDSSVNGTAKVTWNGERLTGPHSNLQLAAELTLARPASTEPGLLPMTGSIAATYFSRGGKVEVRKFQAQTPATLIGAVGSLGVYPISGSSAFNLHVKTANLGEFDRLLTTLGVDINGKQGVAAIPVHLSGAAEFDGSVSQSLIDPDIRGTLDARNFATVFHGSTIHWDSLNAVGEYSATSIAIARAELVRGGATIVVNGRIEPLGEVTSKLSGFRRPEFGRASPVNMTASIHHASVADLTSIVGREYPVTGTVNLGVHIGGTVGNLDGGGTLSMENGLIEAEPYQSAAASWSFHGRQLSLQKLTLHMGSGVAIVNGNYDLDSKKFQVNLDAQHFELSQIDWLKNQQLPLTGDLKFDAHASGTPQSLSVLVGIHLRNVTIRGQREGGVEAFANTNHGVVSFSAHSTGEAPLGSFKLTGETALKGDYPTKAGLEFAGFDLGPLLKTFHNGDLAGPTVLSGGFQIAGLLKQPKQFQGNGDISQLAVTREDIRLTNDGPILASLSDGVVHLTRAHITGPDTDMNISGTAALTGQRLLHLVGSGSINMTLAQMFDPDISSSGHVTFNVEAGGTLQQPSFSGKVRLANVSLALSDLSNGISELNGTLEFDQDRLEVRDLVGRSGGGDLKIGGFITYQQGIYADLTASGKSIRVRYSGLSATADTKLTLQGPERNLLLAGNVLLTRFLVSPNIDFAAFTKPGAPATPPNPNAPSSHVRLDIHVVSSPQLDFQNSYAQLAGSVDLRIRGTIAQPSVLGKISITEGTATFAGTNYRLQRGTVYFTNPVHIEPIVDLDATTRVEEFDVTVGLHGNINHLTPTFRSDPPLPQADVISLLALGRTQQEQLVYSQQQQQIGANNTTNMLLGGALNATVSNRVQQLFGFGSVKIDPNYLGNLGTSSARITVQQNISRTVQLVYARNVNATAEQLIQAQINLTRNVSLLAIRDESDVFSLVIKFHKRLR